MDGWSLGEKNCLESHCWKGFHILYFSTNVQLKRTSKTPIIILEKHNLRPCQKSKDGSSGSSAVVALSLHLSEEIPSEIGRLLYSLLCGPWLCVWTVSEITDSLFTGESPSDLWQSSCYCIEEDGLRLPCFSDPESRKTGVVLQKYRWQDSLT